MHRIGKSDAGEHGAGGSAKLLAEDYRDFEVRAMRPEDLDEVLEIGEQAFDRPWSRRAWQGEFQNPMACYRVVVERATGRIVAYAGYWKQFDIAHITRIAVCPSQRRRGLARMLIMSLVQSAEAKGIERLSLEVRQGNSVAIRFYEALGFRSAGWRKAYYPDTGEDALILDSPPLSVFRTKTGTAPDS